MAGYMIAWQHKTSTIQAMSFDLPCSYMHSLLQYIVQCASSCALYNVS